MDEQTKAYRIRRTQLTLFSIASCPKHVGDVIGFNLAVNALDTVGQGISGAIADVTLQGVETFGWISISEAYAERQSQRIETLDNAEICPDGR